MCPWSASGPGLKGASGTLGTLSGHFLDTLSPGAEGLQGHLVGHSIG